MGHDTGHLSMQPMLLAPKSHINKIGQVLPEACQMRILGIFIVSNYNQCNPEVKAIPLLVEVVRRAVRC